jgi:hypothetical protein
VGVASGSGTNTSQIKNGNSSVPSSAVFNGPSYTDIGIAAGDTINAVQVWANHGEGVSTGTKSGTVGMTNPSITSSTFNFGNDAGGNGTYSTGWYWTSGIADAPSVTKGSATTLNITKTVASTTRTGECDSLFAYVDYTPAASALAPPWRSPGELLAPILCM